MKQGSIQRILWVATALSMFCLLPVLGEGADTKTLQSADASAPSPEGAIPLPEVATRATELSNLLQTLDTQFALSPAIEIIKRDFPGMRAQMVIDLAETMEVLGDDPTLANLQVQQKTWHGRKLQTAAWLKTLTERAIHLQDAITRVERLKARWADTLTAAQASNASPPVLQQIDASVGAIDAARGSLQVWHKEVLDLQAEVSKEVSRCESVQARLSQAQEQAVGGILVRDTLPVWSAELWGHARSGLTAKVHGILTGSWKDMREYVFDGSRGIVLHVGLFTAFALFLLGATRQPPAWATTRYGAASATMVSHSPYAAALIISIFVATAPASPTPLTIRNLLGVLGVLSMIRLLRPVLTGGMMRLLMIMSALFVMEGFRKLLAGAQPIEQSILVLEMAAALAVLGWSIVSGQLQRVLEEARGFHFSQVFRGGSGLLVFCLAAGLIAAGLGYMRLARILASFSLGIGILVFVLYSILQVTVGMVFFTLRAWPLRLLKTVEHHCDMLVRRTHRILIWVAVAAGLSRSLDQLGFLQPGFALAEAVLTNKLERGSISISLGDVLIFTLTVWAAYLLSIFIRFILHEDVYPRMNIDRGQSYAASSLLNYTIIALGIVVGLGVIGVDLTKVTVLAGALGVGIGFGLQSVVNNFVSGLILLFERPIHVGDTIEVGSLLGEVKRIGIRASTIRTRQGADILVPNAQLVTENVTNWTLSDRLRRIDLPVGVNYGAAPDRVIQALEALALAHPQVLLNPPPRGLFVGFGESSINFELRVWTDQSVDWAQIRSDLTVAIHEGIQDAGFAFPFPQREVHLVKVSTEASGPGPVSRVTQWGAPGGDEAD